jgi:hypothetical protein
MARFGRSACDDSRMSLWVVSRGSCDWGTSRDGRGASAVRAVVFLRMLTSSDKAGAAGCSWLAAGAGVAGALLKLGSH